LLQASHILRNVVRSRHLRILAVTVVALAAFGIVDGTLWRTIPSPTLGYRTAILFGCALTFGWRGLMWSQILLLASFLSYFGWRGAVFVEPPYLLSHALAFVVARGLARKESWLSRERSSLAFLVGAILAPTIPAFLNNPILRLLGATRGPGLPAPMGSWLRESSAIFAVVPALLVYGRPLQKWVGDDPAEGQWEPISGREMLPLGLEVAAWAATLWMSVHFRAYYNLNTTYLTFLPPLAFTFYRGMRLAAAALAANAVVATTLWSQLHWTGSLSSADLNLLIAIYSLTILVLAAVVDERQRGRLEIDERKHAEALLRESEKRLRSFADSAPVMIWVSGLDKHSVFVNKSWLDFTGRSMEHETGAGWADTVHPEDIEQHVAVYSSAFDARVTFQNEVRFRRFDGEYRRILVRGVPLVRDGRFTGYIGSCLDVTELYLATEGLRASEVRLREAQRLAAVGSWEREIETDRIQWSDEMLQILGVPDEAPANFASFLSRVHPKDRGRVSEIDGKLLSGISPVELEYRIIRKDGGVRFFRSIVKGVRNDRGALVRVVGATQDVTAQVEARELLQGSEERLRNAERLAHVGNWHWQIENNRLTWSEEMFRIFGKPQDYTPTCDDFFETLLPPNQERMEGELREHLAGKAGHPAEFHIVRPDGDVRIVACVSEVISDEEGLPARIFGACLDITDFRRAHEEIFARQKLETVGTLANGIAHDFNNLLGAVLAQAELAADELAAGSGPEAELKAIREIAIRGSEIVRQLMVYAGRESETLGTVYLSRAVAEIVELLKVAVSKHTTLETDLEGDFAAVRASAAQISQIVMNLVTNASEAIGNQNGVVRVNTRLVTVRGEDSSGPEGLAGGDYMKLEVSDTGRGMPPETQFRAFDPFFTTKSAGRGLGLATVQGIVRSLGGAIHLTSELGKGTTVEVLLPAETIAETARQPLSRPEEPPRSSHVANVLVVEDENPLRQAASKMLRNAGFSVLEAGDGSAALNEIRAQNSPIDVLFLDITLPGASSLEVFQEARRLRPEIRVIVTSAYSEDVAAASLQGRFEGFIRKPYRFGDLMDLIRQVLS
jgi:two-component system, cell cycle sensor histidine kinase and response regulator CckA